MGKELTDPASPSARDAAALPVATCTADLPVRPEPPVSVQEARLALARTSAAAQAAARPPAHSDAIEKRAKVAMNVSGRRTSLLGVHECIELLQSCESRSHCKH